MICALSLPHGIEHGFEPANRIALGLARSEHKALDDDMAANKVALPIGLLQWKRTTDKRTAHGIARHHPQATVEAAAIGQYAFGHRSHVHAVGLAKDVAAKHIVAGTHEIAGLAVDIASCLYVTSTMISLHIGSGDWTPTRRTDLHFARTH